MKTYVLYNPLSGGGKGEEIARQLKGTLKEETTEFVDLCNLDVVQFIGGLEADDKIVLCGGDGTVNQFARKLKENIPENDILYYATGTGNDFWTDLGLKKGDAPVKINEYLKNLPTVYVNGEAYPIINGVGYGIDGYCCEVGDQQRAAGKKDINYTSIAINGLLFHYKPKNATVIVDGKEYTFKKVWIAPTMNGRHYGGGMIAAPDQKRGSGKVSLVLMYGAGRIRTLMLFPSIFKGEHIKNKKLTAVLEGSDITVKFDEPAPLQIDGETILGVTEYRVKA